MAIPVYVAEDHRVTQTFKGTVASPSNFKKLHTYNGISLYEGDGATTPHGNLSGSVGDLCYNGDSGKAYRCTGTTNWTDLQSSSSSFSTTVSAPKAIFDINAALTLPTTYAHVDPRSALILKNSHPTNSSTVGLTFQLNGNYSGDSYISWFAEALSQYRSALHLYSSYKDWVTGNNLLKDKIISFYTPVYQVGTQYSVIQTGDYVEFKSPYRTAADLNQILAYGFTTIPPVGTVYSVGLGYDLDMANQYTVCIGYQALSRYRGVAVGAFAEGKDNSSVAVGYSCISDGVGCTSVGANINASDYCSYLGSSIAGNSSIRAVGIGYNLSIGTDTVTIGYGANSASSNNSVVIGYGANINSTLYSTLIGSGHNVNASAASIHVIGYTNTDIHSYDVGLGNTIAFNNTTGVIALGGKIKPQGNNKAYIGGQDQDTNELIIGKGDYDGSAYGTIAIRPSEAHYHTANCAGSTLQIKTGRNKGNGAAGKLEFYTTPAAGAIGSGLHDWLKRMDIDSEGLMLFTNQTDVSGTVGTYRKMLSFTKFGGGTASIWVSNGTDPNGDFSATTGDICLNCGSGTLKTCTTGNTWA